MAGLVVICLLLEWVGPGTKNLSWKILFAEAKENSWAKNKLYLKSKRIPPLPPPEIEKRLSKVKTELKNLFKNGNKTKVKRTSPPFKVYS